MKAEEQGKDLKSALKESKAVTKLLTAKELDAVMEPTNYVGKAPEMVDRTISQAQAALGRMIL
jgi:adenylosuccinate lyase